MHIKVKWTYAFYASGTIKSFNYICETNNIPFHKSIGQHVLFNNDMREIFFIKNILKTSWKIIYTVSRKQYRRKSFFMLAKSRFETT